ncbi:MAG TPA: DUF4126 family protein [Rubrobacteraceae bacterium]|nr:DUF4126 family protein [Rubrobacteraceae bacterium]
MHRLAARALGLGAITGLRSMSAPAAVSRAAAHGRLGSLEGTPLEALGSARAARLLTVLEIGELIGDKLPITPSRTALPPLLGRAASGALAGAALFASEGRRMALGGALGAAGALASARAGERLRMQISQRLGVPDFVPALVEDGIVLFASSRLTR